MHIFSSICLLLYKRLIIIDNIINVLRYLCFNYFSVVYLYDNEPATPLGQEVMLVNFVFK
jgi:uncharacterized membrane protein